MSSWQRVFPSIFEGNWHRREWKRISSSATQYWRKLLRAQFENSWRFYAFERVTSFLYRDRQVSRRFYVSKMIEAFYRVDIFFILSGTLSKVDNGNRCIVLSSVRNSKNRKSPKSNYAKIQWRRSYSASVWQELSLDTQHLMVFDRAGRSSFHVGLFFFFLALKNWLMFVSKDFINKFHNFRHFVIC